MPYLLKALTQRLQFFLHFRSEGTSPRAKAFGYLVPLPFDVLQRLALCDGGVLPGGNGLVEGLALSLAQLARDVPITVDFDGLLDHAAQFAGTKGFQGIQLGCPLAVASLEAGLAPISLLDRLARQVVFLDLRRCEQERC